MTSFERVALLEAAAGLTATWMALRLVGFRRWKAIAERFARAVEAKTATEVDTKAQVGRDVARMTAAAAHYLPFRSNCLEQSLALWWLLRRRRIAADLKIGARKEANRFEAHAWVEFEGCIVDGASEGHLHFVPFEGSLTSMETQTP